MTTWGDPVTRGKKQEDIKKATARKDRAMGEVVRRATKPVDPDKAPSDQKGIADKPKGDPGGAKK